MATTSTVNVPSSIRVLAILVMAAGAIMVVAGVATWFTVQSQLSDERITVSDDAAHFAGDAVDGPLTAYSQAQTIEKHAMKASGRKTYAELASTTPPDPAMTASSSEHACSSSRSGWRRCRAGLGIVLLLIGWALLSVAKALGFAAGPTVLAA